jgi:hypothetical protein
MFQLNRIWFLLKMKQILDEIETDLGLIWNWFCSLWNWFRLNKNMI